MKYPIPDFAPLTKSVAVIAEQPVNTVAVLIQWPGPSARKDPRHVRRRRLQDVLNQDGSAFQKRLVDSGLWARCW